MIKQISIASESWAKAWPNRQKSYFYGRFNKNFNWFPVGLKVTSK